MKVFQVAVPKSYKHLLRLVRRETELKCDCKGWHLTPLGKVFGWVFVVCLLGAVGMIFISLSWHFVLLINTVVLLFCIYGSHREGWMKAHLDKVVTNLIPTYLYRQINYMNTSLLGSLSTFSLVREEMRKVRVKGTDQKESIQKFLSSLDEKKNPPSDLAEMQKEAEGYSKFKEAHELLMDSESLVLAYLRTKQEEVRQFTKWANSDNTGVHYSVMQEAWLRKARSIGCDLYLLSERFNRYLDDSGVSEFGSAVELSKDAENSARIAKYGANDLLQKLTNFYGVKPDESKKEEPPKPGENKAGEPAAYGETLLTKEDWKELEDLDLSALGRGSNK